MMNNPSFSPHIRPDRAVIRVAGETVLAFLHNLLTVDVLQLQPGESAYGALLTPQGKILHDLFVVRVYDEIWLDCARAQASALLQKLVMYRLRAKLDIVIDNDKTVAVSMDGDLPGLTFVDPRSSAIGFRAIVNSDTQGLATTVSDYDGARLRQGLADSVADIGSGELFVHEANLDQLHGVNFKKGCYVGQEVVSRTQHRGTARSRILPVWFEGEAQHKADVISGGTRLGQMLSSGEGPNEGHGLALLRLDKLAAVDQPPLTGTVRLHVQKPDWMQIEIKIPEVAQ